jgi:hypothetical protein
MKTSLEKNECSAKRVSVSRYAELVRISVVGEMRHDTRRRRPFKNSLKKVLNPFGIFVTPVLRPNQN